ncbi:MAG: hypothetical protein H6739_34965 [Alphaproteobacteria bacterium]|nr:hypothetical protein [Alphaproteobacteria bacterium]
MPTDAKAVAALLSLAKTSPKYQWLIIYRSPTDIELQIVKPGAGSLPGIYGRAKGAQWGAGGRLVWDSKLGGFKIGKNWTRGMVVDEALEKLWRGFKAGNNQKGLPKITLLAKYELVSTDDINLLVETVVQQMIEQNIDPNVGPVLQTQEVDPNQTTGLDATELDDTPPQNQMLDPLDLFDDTAWSNFSGEITDAFGVTQSGLNKLIDLMKQSQDPVVRDIADKELRNSLTRGSLEGTIGSLLDVTVSQGDSKRVAITACKKYLQDLEEALQSDVIKAVDDNVKGEQGATQVTIGFQTTLLPTVQSALAYLHNVGF